MKISRRPMVVLVLLLLSVSGCVSWGNQPTPAPSSSQRLPDPVRVTRNDQSVLTLDDAAVSGDSIVGYAGSDRVRTAVALADVRTMQARKTDFLATVGVTTAITLAAIGIALTIALASLYGD
jgi:type IV pilus biogenesis protein CpaD/CtpE